MPVSDPPITGKETHGGLAIEVIPAYQTGLRSWVAADASRALSFDPYQPYTDPLGTHLLDESKTPKQLGLAAGVALHAHPAVAYKRVTCIVADVSRNSNDTLLTVRIRKL